MLPSSGTIKMSQVNEELGTTGSINLNRADVRKLAGKTNGIIKMSDLYGKSSEFDDIFVVTNKEKYDQGTRHSLLTYASVNQTFENSVVSLISMSFTSLGLYYINLGFNPSVDHSKLIGKTLTILGKQCVIKNYMLSNTDNTTSLQIEYSDMNYNDFMNIVNTMYDMKIGDSGNISIK